MKILSSTMILWKSPRCARILDLLVSRSSRERESSCLGVGVVAWANVLMVWNRYCGCVSMVRCVLTALKSLLPLMDCFTAESMCGMMAKIFRFRSAPHGCAVMEM